MEGGAEEQRLSEIGIVGAGIAGTTLAIACRRAGRNLTCEEWRRFVGEEPYTATCPELPPGC